MKTRRLLRMVAVPLLALSVTAVAQDRESDKKTTEKQQKEMKTNSKDYQDAMEQSQKASKAFTEIMNAPDKAIPEDILARAECVAVFPDVIKAGLIVGGRGGRGVASCRTGNSWSAPAFFNLSGGSIGAQIGVQSTDFVMLFMTKDGINSLLGNKFTMGGDLSVAAGPVGRQAGASTDAALNAQILSYSRSKGLFAGAELKGVAITRDDDTMRAVYGETPIKSVLQDSKATVAAQVRTFPDMLAKYTKRMARQ